MRKIAVFAAQIAAILIAVLSSGSVRAHDGGRPRRLLDLSHALTNPVEFSTGFAIASLSSQEHSFLRPSWVIGAMLFPTSVVSPYADFRVGKMTFGSDGELAEGISLSSEFEKNGFATATFGSLLTVYRRNGWWFNFYGEYETTIGGGRATVNELTLDLRGMELPIKDQLSRNDEFEIDWRRWEVGATIHGRFADGPVWGFLSVALDGHSTSVDVSLSEETSGLLTLIGKTPKDVEGLNGNDEVRPAFLPGVEVTITPWMRWYVEGIVVPLLKHDGFAYGGNTRFVFAAQKRDPERRRK